MAEMKARHAFGSSERVLESIQNGVIDSYDILFLDGDTDNPKIGWVSKDGKPVILKDEKADLTEIEFDLAALETAMATKANAEEVKAELATKTSAEEVDSKIKAALGEIECAPETYEKVKYEIADVPEGTLVKMNENEIRIMVPADATWTKQAVGSGGDLNCYYCTLKTYVYDDNVTGYIEHLGDQVDEEILTDLKTDEYGRRYQPSWLALARYDEATDTWTYYGKSSSEAKYIGWDYQLDLYDADGVMVASDSIRISLSNEDCHYSIEPYYVGKIRKDVDTIIDEKIAEVANSMEVIEF